MDPPLLFQAPLSFSASFKYPAAPFASTECPLPLGEGWNLFWRKDAEGVFEVGVTGGVVKSNWQSIRFQIKVPGKHWTLFGERTDTTRIVDETSPGFAPRVDNVCCHPGFYFVSTLEVNLSSAEIRDLPTSSPFGISTAGKTLARRSPL